MKRNQQKSGTQTTLFDQKGCQSKTPQKQETKIVDKKGEESEKQIRKSSRIQQKVIQEQEEQQAQKKISKKTAGLQTQAQTQTQTQTSGSKQKGNGGSGQQTKLNYQLQDNSKLEVGKTQSQSMSSQKITSIQSTNTSPNIFTLPKQDHLQFSKIISDLNIDSIVPKLQQFNSFISSLIANITTYLLEQKRLRKQIELISQNTILKIEKQIRYILFRFLTGSPFSMWNTLYCPQRVSQLVEESNGKLIQLWIRKYYKGIKDKLKSESLFGYVDSDEDFSEYFDHHEPNANMNEEYTSLLNTTVCKNWKNKGNILVLNGTQGCGKTTALRSAIKSLKMQIIEINNSMKRGGTDLRKITEITQSCRLNNNNNSSQQQTNEKQQVQQKGILSAFFAPKKKAGQTDATNNEPKDQINIDAKDSSKKVIYFRNFDIQLDTLFQNEVLKLSENSKVPFILSTNIDEEQNMKQQNIIQKDTVDFQKINDEQMTILLYIIFEVERNFRQFHFQSSLYVSNLVNQNEQTGPQTNSQAEKEVNKLSESKEDILINSEEFKTFLASFPQITSDLAYLPIINKLVRILNGDLNTCLLFIQDNLRLISNSSECKTLAKSIEYTQQRNIKLANLSQLFVTPLPLSSLSNQFKFQIENSYQIFLLSADTEMLEQSRPENEDISKEIDILEEYLKNIESIQYLDVLDRKIKAQQKRQQILLLQESLFNNEGIDYFYTPGKKLGREECLYDFQRIEEDVECQLQQICRNLNSSSWQKQIMHEEQKQQYECSSSDIISISNFLQNDIRDIFLDQYKNYDILTDKIDKADKVYVRKSQISSYFLLIPALDTIKMSYNVGSKRTRSQQNKGSKDLNVNPLSILEQTVNQNLYNQFKIILSQFNLRKGNSFGQFNKRENSQIYLEPIQEMQEQSLSKDKSIETISTDINGRKEMVPETIEGQSQNEKQSMQNETQSHKNEMHAEDDSHRNQTADEIQIKQNQEQNVELDSKNLESLNIQNNTPSKKEMEVEQNITLNSQINLENLVIRDGDQDTLEELQNLNQNENIKINVNHCSELNQCEQL